MASGRNLLRNVKLQWLPGRIQKVIREKKQKKRKNNTKNSAMVKTQNTKKARLHPLPLMDGSCTLFVKTWQRGSTIQRPPRGGVSHLPSLAPHAEWRRCRSPENSHLPSCLPGKASFPPPPVQKKKRSGIHGGPSLKPSLLPYNKQSVCALQPVDKNWRRPDRSRCWAPRARAPPSAAGLQRGR